MLSLLKTTSTYESETDKTQRAFPIYLDYAASTPIDQDVLLAMTHVLQSECGNFGNAASTHVYGLQALRKIQQARMQVAALINADEKEIIWTSGATEANNLALRGLAKSGVHIITVKTEHKSILETARALESLGCEVTYLDVDKHGYIDLSSLKNAIKENTVLVSVMHVNNEIGVIQDIASISAIVHESNALLHVDAAQSAGKIPIDVTSWNIDLLSLSAHKLYGPQGVGALYVRLRPRVPLRPLLTGGNQERGLRAGTLATHQITGMGVACERARRLLDCEYKRLIALRERLWEGLAQLEGIHRQSRAEGAPHILNISIEGVNGEALTYLLEENIAVSSGSACNAYTIEPSHVLMALGVSPYLAQSTLRFSLGRWSTEAEMDQAGQCVKTMINHLRRLSPYWEKPIPDEIKNSDVEKNHKGMRSYLLSQEHIGTLDESDETVRAFHWHSPTSRLRGALYLRVQEDTIRDVRFKMEAPPVCMASLAWIAKQLIFQPYENLENLNVESLISALDVPDNKVHQALLIFECVEKMRKNKNDID